MRGNRRCVGDVVRMYSTNGGRMKGCRRREGVAGVVDYMVIRERCGRINSAARRERRL